jgi:GcrA cell cycle regulator
MRVSRPSTRGNTALAPVHGYEIDIEPETELIENIVPIGQRCTLLELSEDKCRWPIGDPGSTEFFFCGGKPIDTLPYCSYHSRLAYQPVAERRREKRAERA